MRAFARSFLDDESGTVSVDWIVLTAVLVGTGLSILATVRSGVGFASTEVAEQLRGQVIQSSFQSDQCVGGLDEVQRMENARAAAQGRQPIQVSTWLDNTTSGMSDAAIDAELNRLRSAVGSNSTLTLEGTMLAALECHTVINGR